MFIHSIFQKVGFLLVLVLTGLGARAETKTEAERKALAKASEEGKALAKAGEEGKALTEAKTARKKAEEETKEAVKEAAGEAAMEDESKPADSLPEKGETAELHEDCGEDFAAMKKAERLNQKKKGATRGNVAVYSGFTLEFQGEKNPFTLMTTTVLPKEKLTFKVTDAKEGEAFSAVSDDGAVSTVSPRSWSWTAPEAPGHYCLKVSRVQSADMACLQVFVLKPYAGEETLNGYPIGQYPESTVKKDDPVHQRPRGFIEVTAENLDTWVSPHFQLRQFLCKGFDGYPQYALIRPRLLLKLEMLSEAFTKAGLPGSDIYVMSGFRTPAYNTKIGNKTTLSRHTFGDATDIYIDADRDGMIDDLNKDGKTDTEDARLMHTIVKELKRTEPWQKPLGGGLSLYPAKPERSAFIHVDARGTDLFWDNL
jgi:hypothetical protein